MSIYFFLPLITDTKTDPFQQNFDFEEKKHFFKTKYKNADIDTMNKIASDCELYQVFIMDRKTQNLGEIFLGVKIRSIHKCSFILMIIFFFLIFILAVSILSLITSPQNFFSMKPQLSNVRGLISCVNVFVFIYIAHLFYSGEIPTYCEFLSCDNVNYEGFKKYRSIEKLNHDFKRFMIFTFIGMLCGIFDSSN